MFDRILKSIEKMQEQHYFVGWLLIPSLALINFYIIVALTNKLQLLIKFKPMHSPAFVSLVYVAAYITPFVIHQVLESRHESTA